MASIFEKNWISDYKLHEDINWHPDINRNTVGSTIQVIDDLDHGKLTLSDIYTLFAVHTMTFANLYHISEYMKWWSNFNKELPIQNTTGEEALDAFNGRLEALTKASLIRRYLFTPAEGKARVYYYVTGNGYYAIKNAIGLKGPYNQNLGLLPVQEVMKYLAINEVFIKLLSKTKVEQGYHVMSKKIYASHISFFDKATRENIMTYGFANIRKSDSKKKILFEPYRPTYDKNGYCEGHMKTNQEERFEFIERYVKAYIRDNAGIHGLQIAFICEDMDAVKKLANRVKLYPTHIRECIVMSVDKIIEKHGLKNTFLKINDKDGKLMLSSASLDI